LPAFASGPMRASGRSGSPCRRRVDKPKAHPPKRRGAAGLGAIATEWREPCRVANPQAHPPKCRGAAGFGTIATGWREPCRVDKPQAHPPKRLRGGSPPGNAGCAIATEWREPCRVDKPKAHPPKRLRGGSSPGNASEASCVKRIPQPEVLYERLEIPVCKQQGKAMLNAKGGNDHVGRLPDGKPLFP